LISTAIPATIKYTRSTACARHWLTYIYDTNGVLVERKPDQKGQGRSLSFLAKEMDTYRPAVLPRPRGSKNK
jgi:hypothetical protein